MTWKNGRELETATNGTHTVNYDYDVNGLRTCKIVDGIQHDYIYASGQLLRETYTESGTAYTLDFLYDQSGRPYLLYLTTKEGSDPASSTPYYFILNLQGDVLYLADASGEPVASYTYDPYGAILTATGSLADVNPLRYRGYYYDTETGFYYLQSRYYDPALGRFLNADSYASTGQGFLGYNMFVYCNNTPINGVDPSGHFFIELLREWLYGTGQEVAMADGPVPAGDAVYVAGIVILGGLSLLELGVTYFASSNSSATVDGVSSASMPAFQQFAEQNVKDASIETKSVAGSTPATPPNNGNERDYRRIRSNSRANEIAEKCGFENAEALKEWYVGRSNISKFNMYIDNVTNEVILIAIQGGTVVPTGCIIP